MNYYTSNLLCVSTRHEEVSCDHSWLQSRKIRKSENCDWHRQEQRAQHNPERSNMTRLCSTVQHLAIKFINHQSHSVCARACLRCDSTNIIVKLFVDVYVSTWCPGFHLNISHIWFIKRSYGIQGDVPRKDPYPIFRPIPLSYYQKMKFLLNPKKKCIVLNHVVFSDLKWYGKPYIHFLTIFQETTKV